MWIEKKKTCVRKTEIRTSGEKKTCEKDEKKQQVWIKQKLVNFNPIISVRNQIRLVFLIHNGLD